MLPEAAPAPVLPQGSWWFQLYQLTAASRPALETGFLPAVPYRGAEPWPLLCFRSCCKIQEGNSVLGEEWQIPGRLSAWGSCP